MDKILRESVIYFLMFVSLLLIFFLQYSKPAIALYRLLVIHMSNIIVWLKTPVSFYSRTVISHRRPTHALEERFRSSWYYLTGGGWSIWNSAHFKPQRSRGEADRDMEPPSSNIYFALYWRRSIVFFIFYWGLILGVCWYIYMYVLLLYVTMLTPWAWFPTGCAASDLGDFESIQRLMSREGSLIDKILPVLQVRLSSISAYVQVSH